MLELQDKISDAERPQRTAPALRSRLFAAVVAALLGCGGGGARQLRVLAWPGYADDDWVEAFEQRCGCTVQVVLARTDDDIWEKVHGSAGRDFDVFAINTAQLQRYIDAGLVAPHDLSKLPNQARTTARFRDLSLVAGAMRDGKVYGIPFAFDAIGLVYDVDRVQPAPDSLSVLWDPRYKGQVLGYDNGEISFSVAALALGAEHPFRLSPSELQAAQRKLLQLKRNALRFYSTAAEALELYQKHEVALILADYGQQQVKLLRDAGARIGYVNPKEGALAWLDTWALASGAREPDLAEAWIDSLLRGEVGRALSERTGFGNTTAPFTGAAEGDRLVWLEPVEDPARRSALWDEIQATD